MNVSMSGNFLIMLPPVQVVSPMKSLWKNSAAISTCLPRRHVSDWALGELNDLNQSRLAHIWLLSRGTFSPSLFPPILAV